MLIHVMHMRIHVLPDSDQRLLGAEVAHVILITFLFGKVLQHYPLLS